MTEVDQMSLEAVQTELAGHQPATPGGRHQKYRFAFSVSRSTTTSTVIQCQKVMECIGLTSQ